MNILWFWIVCSIINLVVISIESYYKGYAFDKSGDIFCMTFYIMIGPITLFFALLITIIISIHRIIHSILDIVEKK